MSSTKILPGIPALWPILPSPVRALWFLWRARVALQGASWKRAYSVASEGVQVLDSQELKATGSANPIRNPAALKAALDATIAIAQRQHGDSSEASRCFSLAATEFGRLIVANEAGVAPFLSDYLSMLVAFQDQDKLAGVAGYLSQGAAGGAFELSPMWLQTALVSQTPRMLLDLANSLRWQDDGTQAIDSYLHSASLGIVTADGTTAEDAIQEVLEFSPENHAALHLRGFLRWEGGQYEDAIRDFTEVAAGNRAYVAPRIALADACLRMGREDVAAMALEEAAVDSPSKSPSSMNDLLLRAEADRFAGLLAHRQGDEGKARHSWSAALGHLNEYLDKDDSAAHAKRSRALVHYYLGHLELALTDLNSSLSSAPNHIAANGWKAMFYLEDEKKHFSEALAAVNVAIALLGPDPHSSTLKPWLLGLKGRALIDLGWMDQAIESLAEAVELTPTDEKAAAMLMRAAKRSKDDQAIAKRASQLQENSYPANFLRTLRLDEVAAHRVLGDYGAAFQAINREPQPVRDHPTIWMHARLLADVGNFEAARDLLAASTTGPSRDINHLSLQGWVIQNLEPATAEERAEMAIEGCRLYESALEALKGSKQRPFDAVWIRKGLANALLRVGQSEAARENYQNVIEECERLMRQAESSARAMALMGWCHHCLGGHRLALRYYQAAGAGNESIAGAFDRALVLLASAGQIELADESNALSQYKTALERAVELNPLRRIGIVRVALHDLKELLFRTARGLEATEIIEMLSGKLLQDTAGIDGDYDGLADRIYAFLEVVKMPPSGDSPAASETLARPSSPGPYEANEPGLEQSELAALLESAKSCESRGDLAKAQEAAHQALSAGLYAHNPAGARSLVALATRNAVKKICSAAEYEATIRDAFAAVGSGRAYLDLLKIEREMSPPERSSPEESRLLIGTVVRLFFNSHDDEWIYVDEASGTRKVPSVPALVRKLSPYLRLERFNARGANEMGL